MTRPSDDEGDPFDVPVADAVPVLSEVPGELPEGMTGAEILDRTVAVLRRFSALPSDHTADAIALFIASTWTSHAVELAPYLFVSSAEKQSGKTVLMDVLVQLVARPLPILLPTAPVLFRLLGANPAEPRCLLLDEVDAYGLNRGSKGTPMSEEIRAVLNGGNRQGATVPRCTEGGRGGVEEYHVYGPKVLAGIANCLPETVLDRCIPVTLMRATPEEARDLTPSRHRNLDAAGAEVRPLLHAWTAAIAEDVGADVAAGVPAFDPGALTSRAADTWSPLIAIADLAGEDWPQRARAAAAYLSAPDYDPDEGTVERRLLMACHEAFGDDVRVASSDLVDRLRAMPDEPWGTMSGTGLDQPALSRMLKRYGCRPHVAKCAAGHDPAKAVRLYDRAEFVAPWVRYCGIADADALGPITPQDADARRTDVGAAQKRAEKAVAEVRTLFAAEEEPDASTA